MAIGSTENLPVKARAFSTTGAIPTASEFGEGIAIVGKAFYVSDGLTWTPDLVAGETSLNSVVATHTTQIAGLTTNSPVKAAVTLAANGTLVLPVNAVIVNIVINNTTANAVTGGLNIGTTNGGIDVLNAYAVGANAFAKVSDDTVLASAFSAATTLYIQAASAWNSASLNITVFYIVAA